MSATSIHLVQCNPRVDFEFQVTLVIKTKNFILDFSILSQFQNFFTAIFLIDRQGIISPKHISSSTIIPVTKLA